MAEGDTAWTTYARLAELTTRLFFGLPEVFVMKALLDAPRETFLGGETHRVYQLDEDLVKRLRLFPVYVRKVRERERGGGLKRLPRSPNAPCPCVCVPGARGAEA